MGYCLPLSYLFMNKHLGSFHTFLKSVSYPILYEHPNKTHCNSTIILNKFSQNFLGISLCQALYCRLASFYVYFFLFHSFLNLLDYQTLTLSKCCLRGFLLILQLLLRGLILLKLLLRWFILESFRLLMMGKFS